MVRNERGVVQPEKREVQVEDAEEVRRPSKASSSKEYSGVRIRVIVTQSELREILRYSNHNNNSSSSNSNSDQCSSSFNSSFGVKELLKLRSKRRSVSCSSRSGSWKPDLESIPEEYY